MFENKHQQLIPRHAFYSRQLRYAIYALLILLGSLSIGVVGYAWLADLSFIDALLNASMILGGMGPVDVLHNPAAKLFASFYAIFSGIAFLSTIGIFIAPLVHRFMHKLHLEDERETQSP
jgi:hypothetical protein